MSMTLTEKLLARAAGKHKAAAGDTLLVDVNVMMTHDVCGPGTIGVFQREFGPRARVWDPQRVVIIPDHYIFTSDRRSNRNVDILRQFVREQGIRHFYDVIDDENGVWAFDPSQGPLSAQHGSRYAGVCHVALAEKGHTRPGEVLVGTDSHTCTAGAFNEFATGIGNTDAAFVMGTGKILLRVPETMRLLLDGEMGPGVMAKDVILHVIGKIGFDGATYRAMEFGGDGVSALTIEDRMTIANMGVEAGAKNAIFDADETTRSFVDARMKEHGTTRPYEPVSLDGGAKYAAEHRVNLSALEPTVAMPPDPGRCRTARELAGVRTDRAYIGSCTGGKAVDFEAFADVVRGKRVVMDTFGVPATPAIVRYLKGTKRNGQSLWDILVASGVRMTENAGCGACLGGPADTFGRMNEPVTCISTTNRNFPGHMGHPDGQVYLASPYTVAASALAGHIADPRDYLERQEDTAGR